MSGLRNRMSTSNLENMMRVGIEGPYSDFDDILTSITIFVNLGIFRNFETVTNIRTWIESHKFWRML